ncbi:hypothetical protein [Lacticaseibacillus sp. GG6-2]
MKKPLIAIFGVSGVVICVLAVSDFVTSPDNWAKRVAMLAGLLIFGLLYTGLAIAMSRGKMQRRINAGTKLGFGLATAALIVGVAMIGWVMAMQAITLHGIAIAWTVLAYLLCSWLDALDNYRLAA